MIKRGYVKQQLQTMLTLQQEMNTRVHPQWHCQGYPWYRAIWVESAELLDHYGWKWWKRQQCEREQVELELIDIWHFGLSDMLQRADCDIDKVTYDLERKMPSTATSGDFPALLESFTLSVLQVRQFDSEKFAQLLTAAQMPFERLFRGYVGKNVLNFFRQDHGYQDGTYRKIWQGREDNEHLVEVLTELNCDSETFREELYDALLKRYTAAG